MKLYLKDLTIGETITRLKNGEVIKIENSEEYIEMIDGIICYYSNDGDVILGASIFKNQGNRYFEVEESFEIKETGLYKTRDGRKVFVSCIDYELNAPVIGIIQGENDATCWYLSGDYSEYNKNSDLDIIGKWED